MNSLLQLIYSLIGLEKGSRRRKCYSAPDPIMDALNRGSKWTAMDRLCLSVQYDLEQVYLNIPTTDVSLALAERNTRCLPLIQESSQSAMA
jgi:hypothetical protein